MDRYWDVAGKLMTRASVPLERHLLMRENLATYLVHFPDEFVGKLDREEATPRSGYAVGRQEWRWADKLVRDLEKPYTDDEVRDRVKELDAELKQVAAELMEHAGRRIYLTGSAVKGRLGAHSDLDCVVEGSSYRGKLVSVHSCGLASFGANVPVEPAEVMQRNVVSDLWRAGLEEKGFLVQGGEVARVRESERKREPEPAVDTGFFIPIGELP